MDIALLSTFVQQKLATRPWKYEACLHLAHLWEKVSFSNWFFDGCNRKGNINILYYDLFYVSLLFLLYFAIVLLNTKDLSLFWWIIFINISPEDDLNWINYKNISKENKKFDNSIYLISQKLLSVLIFCNFFKLSSMFFKTHMNIKQWHVFDNRKNLFWEKQKDSV